MYCKFLMYKSHNIMLLLCDMKLVSRDKSVDLTGDLSCHATMCECLRHNHFSLRQVPMMWRHKHDLLCLESKQAWCWDWPSIEQPCSRYIIKNTYAMNTYVILHFEHKNDITIIIWTASYLPDFISSPMQSSTTLKFRHLSTSGISF